MTMRSKLVAVTPARNEERYIAKCITSVLNQSYPVILHLIVDDWSDDRTREIAKSFGKRIMVISSNLERGTKVHGIRPHLVTEVGIRKVTELVRDWEFCLLLDGDVWLPSNYCEVIIGKMEKNPRLVMAGARFLKTPTGLEAARGEHVRSSNHIIQRRFYARCKIGYNSIHGEVLLERMAAISGLKTQTFPLAAFEGRPTGTTTDNPLLNGIYYYKLGYPLLHSLLKLRSPNKRYLFEVIGWIYAKLHGEKRHFREDEVKVLYRDYIGLLLAELRSSIIGSRNR